VFEKLTVTQLIKKFPAFYGNQISLSLSQDHATGPYPEADASTPQLPTVSFRSIQIFSYHLSLGLPSGLFLSVFPTKIFYTFLIGNKTHGRNKLTI